LEISSGNLRGFGDCESVCLKIGTEVRFFIFSLSRCRDLWRYWTRHVWWDVALFRR